ncbi:methyl-accepting chemotaxis protein [Sporobacter termitidis DSM 10068]|uniref:Methyl-accepting chemotaxis protein n=1 Tax=Sporobacter termitidis DSM 10068 TaxID=1123282 RepID=A0A1M5Y626_9FIRM|nr:methyl-accepting chemotaxis protein [Sporobacter termitidis]SHI07520.1 methyl-accepting chemotaxis protein [Sporobacter termitidis DSM 10068]
MLKKFRNLKISTKLLTGFLIVAVIAGAVGAIGLANIQSLTKSDALLYSDNTMGLHSIAKLEIYFERIRYDAIKFLSSSNTHTRNTCITEIEGYFTQSEDFMRRYDGTVTEQADREQFDTLKQQFADYKAAMDKALEYMKISKDEDAKAVIYGDLTKVGDAMQDTFDGIFQYNVDAAQAREAQNAGLSALATAVMSAVVAVAVAAAIAFGLIISKTLSRPIVKMVKAAESLAGGNIDVDIGVDTKDEIGALAASFRTLADSTRAQVAIMRSVADGDLTVRGKARTEGDALGKSIVELLEKLNTTVKTIMASADQVASGAVTVSDSSQALSQGATEQASSVEELTAALLEISEQIRRNVEHTEKAKRLAIETEEGATRGNGQMDQMLGAMEDIHASSQNIRKVIKVIDDIAFQTNILALNAAVEAARAGQHGKGFAVVADEVRHLASRSADAVKETADMIENTIRKVDDGTRIARSTAGAFREIIKNINNTAALISGISAASVEQSSGVEQVNQGIAMISRVVQTTAATSEETAAASEELSNEAEQLKEMISFFRISEEPVGVPGAAYDGAAVAAPALSGGDEAI